jgi:hypothetical protein
MKGFVVMKKVRAIIFVFAMATMFGMNATACVDACGSFDADKLQMPSCCAACTHDEVAGATQSGGGYTFLIIGGVLLGASAVVIGIVAVNGIKGKKSKL